MSKLHTTLSTNHWRQLSLAEKMANIGAEVGRASNWRHKNNLKYSQQSFYRALELIDLTINTSSTYPQIKEICRVREALVDYFEGDNNYSSTDSQWKKYFLQFNHLARS